MEAAQTGGLIGHAVEGVRCVITDGATHAVDSSEMAFKIAMLAAFRQCYPAGANTRPPVHPSTCRINLSRSRHSNHRAYAILSRDECLR
jgi:translation elongation factor EF-G